MPKIRGRACRYAGTGDFAHLLLRVFARIATGKYAAGWLAQSFARAAATVATTRSTVRAGIAGTCALPNLPRRHPRARCAAAFQIDVVDLEQASLHGRWHDDESAGQATIIVAIGLTHGIEHIGNNDIVHGQGDRSSHSRFEHDVVRRAVRQPFEKRSGLGVRDRHIEARFVGSVDRRCEQQCTQA